MMIARFRVLLAVARMFLLGSAPVVAQVTVTPETVGVFLTAGETTEVVLTVSNAGADTSLALSLAPAPDDPPEAPGTVLFTSDDTCCTLRDPTITADGNLVVNKTTNEAVEFTPELAFVREFDHPETTIISANVGVTFDADRARFWWLDIQNDDDAKQALLLESDLDGNATGRSLSAAWNPEPSACGNDSGRPTRLAYDAVATANITGGTGRFYQLDLGHDTIWALDSLGTPIDGYPVAQTDYAGRPSASNPQGCLINDGIDAHALSSVEGQAGSPVLEVLTGYPFRHPRNRAYTAVVTDRMGRNRGAETPLFDLPAVTEGGVVRALEGAVRSREDPSVLYVSVVTSDADGFHDYLYAVRAAPLPPVWLHGAPILFSVEGGSETELTLTLDASGLEPGVYEAVASVREGDGIGPVVAEVPVTLTVAPVGSEAGPEEAQAFELGEPYPNPSAGSVTVPVVLSERVEVRLVVYDVLGREVAVLVDEALEAGAHRFAFDPAALPSGVYLVRATVGTHDRVEPLIVTR